MTVCDQVPSTKCELVAYTDCRMFTETLSYNETEVVSDGEYIPWECSNYTREEIHVKLVREYEELHVRDIPVHRTYMTSCTIYCIILASYRSFIIP